MVKTKRIVTRKNTINTPISIVNRLIRFDFKKDPTFFMTSSYFRFSLKTQLKTDIGRQLNFFISEIIQLLTAFV